MPQVKEKWCYTLTFSWLGRHFYPKKKQITSEEQAVLCVSNQPYVSLTGRKLVFEGEENCQEEAAHNKNKMQFLRLRTETRNKMKMNLRFDSEYLLCCRLCRVQPIQIRQLIFLWCRTIMFVCLLPLCCSYSGRGIVVVAQPDNGHTSHLPISVRCFFGESINWSVSWKAVTKYCHSHSCNFYTVWLKYIFFISRLRAPDSDCRSGSICAGWSTVRADGTIELLFPPLQQQMLLNCWYVPELKQLICSAGLDTCRSLFFSPPFEIGLLIFCVVFRRQEEMCALNTVIPFVCPNFKLCDVL